MSKAKKQTASLPQKIARTAVWMLVIPAVVVVQAIRGQKEPRIKR